jgi:hypothetical protein
VREARALWIEGATGGGGGRRDADVVVSIRNGGVEKVKAGEGRNRRFRCCFLGMGFGGRGRRAGQRVFSRGGRGKSLWRRCLASLCLGRFLTIGMNARLYFTKH